MRLQSETSFVEVTEGVNHAFELAVVVDDGEVPLGEGLEGDVEGEGMSFAVADELPQRARWRWC